MLAHDFPGGLGTMLLLSDGTVMASTDQIDSAWWKLTPQSGSYLNGTWSALAPASTGRLFFGSDVLNDGRVLVLGGEYANGSATASDVNTGEIYDPVKNAWTTNFPAFPQAKFGDGPTEVLPDGRVLAGDIFSSNTYIYNPTTNSWNTTNVPTLNNGDSSAEETWVKLPDGSILTYDLQGSQTQSAQRFVLGATDAQDKWIPTGPVPVQLGSRGGNNSIAPELGPAFRLPDGRIFFLGASGKTAFYTPPAVSDGAGTWSQGPDIPDNLGAFDAPGAMMPNGKILLVAGPIDGNKFGAPTEFEFDPATAAFTDVSPGSVLVDGHLVNLDNSKAQEEYARMLVLPSGDVLVSFGTSFVFEYTPDGGPAPAWRPAISSITPNAGDGFKLTGTQLNGISEGASYGDDAQMASNYPIVQLTDLNGNVSYARTTNWSSTGVATSTPVWTTFKLPAGDGPGAYYLSAIANGIASTPVLVDFGSGSDDTVSVGTTTIGLLHLPSLTVNGVPIFYDPSAIAGIHILPAGGNNTINVQATTVPVNIEGNSIDTVNIGSAAPSLGGTLANITAPVNVSNTFGPTTLNVDDSGDTTARTSHMGTIPGSPGLGYIYGLDHALITYDYAHTARLTINTSRANGDVFGVWENGAPTILIGHATASVFVGDGYVGVGSILGTLNIENPASLTTVNVDDTERTGQALTLSSFVNAIDSEGNADLWGKISAAAVGNINYEYGDTSGLTVNTGDLGTVHVQDTGILGDEGRTTLVNSGTETIDIQATTGSLTVQDYYGTAFVDVSTTAENLDNLAGALTVDGDGTDVLTVNDQNNTHALGTEYTITSKALTRDTTDFFGVSHYPAITFSGLGSLELSAGSYPNPSAFPNRVHVESTAAPTRVNAGAGTLLIDISAQAENLDNIGDVLTIHGNGTVPLIINDQNNAHVFGTQYALASTALTRNTTEFLGVYQYPVIIFSGLGSLKLNPGSNPNASTIPNQVNVQSTAAPTTVNAGAGFSTVSVGSSLTSSSTLDLIQGIVTVNGQGSTSLNLNDQGTAAAQGYVFLADSNAGSFFRNFAAGVVNYQNVVSVTLNGGSGGNTVSVTATPAGTSLTVNPGAGTGFNTVDVGTSLTPSSTMDYIRGVVNVNGQGSTFLDLNDQGTAAAQGYVFLADSDTGSFFRNLAPGVVNYQNVVVVTLNGGSGGNTVAVTATPANTTLTVSPGTGADNTVDVGSSLTPSSTLDYIRGVVNVNGQGSTALDLNDKGSAGAEDYDFLDGGRNAGYFFRDFAAGVVNYQNVSSVTLNGGSGGNTVAVTATPASTALTVSPGTGANNTVNVGSSLTPSSVLDLIRGAVRVIGQGSTTLNVNDQGASPGQTYTITAGTVDRTGVARIVFSSIQSLVLNTGTSNPWDTLVYLQGTAVGTAVTVNTGAGNGIAVGNSANSLDDIQGPVTIQGQLNDNFSIADLGSSADHTYTLRAVPSISPTANRLTRSGAAPITYIGMNTLQMTGGVGANTFNVESLANNFVTRIYGGSGLDVFNVSPLAHDLDNISGILDLEAEFPGRSTANASLTFNDQGHTAARNWLFEPGALVVYPSAGSAAQGAVIYFDLFNSVVANGGGGGNTISVTGATAGTLVTINTGSGDDTVNVANVSPVSPITVNGGGGTNTLIGPSTADVWKISALDRGALDRISFVSFANLVGGPGVDRFQFAPAGQLTGTIDGGGGGDWLDYSRFRSVVTVNLATGAATAVAGGVSNIQNARGGNAGGTLTGNALGNILVGGSGADVLVGGSGRSVLIGGGGNDAITGGAGDDILIGGTTDFDARDAALQSILVEWQRTDRTYQQRIADLTNGGGSNRGIKLIFGKSVQDDGRSNVLTGGSGLDWFFKGRRDRITDRQPGEQVN
jgi:hypothetical protein